MLVILVHVDIDISELETSLKLLVYNHFHSTALIILDLQMREMLRSNPTLAKILFQKINGLKPCSQKNVF